VLKRLKSPTPEKTVKAHIKLLHDFNEIRDVGLGLIGGVYSAYYRVGKKGGMLTQRCDGTGMVAENRGTRVQNVMEGGFLNLDAH
jgi:Swi5